MQEITGILKRRRIAGSGVLFRSLVLLCGWFFVAGCEVPVEAPGPTKAAGPARSAEKDDELVAGAYRIISECLADNDPTVRVNAIEVVADARLVRFMPKVQRMLDDESVPVRFAAALAIGDLEYSIAHTAVRRLFKDPDSNVKIAACYAMVRLGSVRYVEVLRRAIASSDQTVRANAAFLLGKCNDTEAARLLVWAMLNKDSEDKVVYQAAESLAMIKDERIFPKLWAMLLSAYADVRVTGVRAMGTLGSRDAKNALITMLDDKVLEVRLAAAEQLGKLGDPIGEPVVREVFEKKLAASTDKLGRDRVYVLATLAIGQIGTDSLTRYLPRLMNDASKAVRIAAAKAVLQSRMRY